MDFRLDKVDSELRQRIKETTSTGKVHTKSGTFINKDGKNKKQNNSQNFDKELEKYNNKKSNKRKKLISVEAVKSKELNVPAYKEENEDLVKNSLKGHILDVKK